MKLLLRRNQSAGMLGKPTFSLEVRAEISDQDRANIQKYRLGDTMLYEKLTITDKGSGLLGLASRAYIHALNVTVSVKDLVNGKRIDCKNVVEMLAIEEHIKETAQRFGQVLRAAQHFGGEEAVEI